MDLITQEGNLLSGCAIQPAGREHPQSHSRANAIVYVVFTSALPDGLSLADVAYESIVRTRGK